MLIEPALTLLNERVAEAVDAWLTDPQDAGVYQRLLAAVAARRAHLRGAAEPAVAPQDDGAARVNEGASDGESGDSGDGTVRAVGDLLDPRDVRAALDRLRGAR